MKSYISSTSSKTCKEMKKKNARNKDEIEENNILSFIGMLVISIENVRAQVGMEC